MIDKLIQEYKGKFIDLDGFPKGSKYQCWDLGQEAFNRLGLDYWLICKWSGGVKDIWEHRAELFDLNDWEFEQNEYHTIPKKNDIVIWDGTFGGGYGHIAIVIEGDLNTLTVFEQNAGQGIGGGIGDECKITTYPNYRGVYGFIRPKNSNQTEKPNQISKPKPDWVKFEKICGVDHTIYFQNIVNDNNWALAVNDYADRVAEVNKLREEKWLYIQHIEKQEKEIENLKKDWAVLDKQGTDARAENQKLKSEIENLKNQTQIEIIKNPDSTNQSQKVFETINDITAQINTKTQTEPKDNQNIANKPFWQSKKFASLVLSTGIGALAVYFKVDNLDTVLSTIASIEMMYLGSQGLVDSGLVKQIVNNFKK